MDAGEGGAPGARLDVSVAYLSESEFEVSIARWFGV
jgi:hypothetical protein